MLDAAIKALAQMFSPPSRAVLVKSIGLALILIVLFGVGLHRLLVWLADLAERWASGGLGPVSDMPLAILAKRLRKTHQDTIFVAGMIIAAFVSIPILNLATPLFGMAFMVHMHKRLAGARKLAAPEEPPAAQPPSK